MSLFELIKPRHFRDDIKSSLKKTIQDFLKLKPKMEIVPCPFCKSENKEDFFKIHNINFLKCQNCGSIYTSPRPSKSDLEKFYSLKPSAKTDTELLPEVRRNRIEKIMKPRWNLIHQKLQKIKFKLPVETVVEIGAGIGHFLEIVKDSNVAKKYIAIEPTQECQEILSSIDFIKSYKLNLEDITDKIEGDLIFINSVIEHPHSLDIFFKQLEKILSPNGVISLFDMHSNGADISILKEHSQNVNPLLILQIGSIKGIQILCERHNLEVVSYSSEGELDTDIIFEYTSEMDHHNPLSGMKYFLSEDKFRSKFQEFLKQQNSTGYNLYLIKKKSKKLQSPND